VNLKGEEINELNDHNQSTLAFPVDTSSSIAPSLCLPRAQGE